VNPEEREEREERVKRVRIPSVRGREIFSESLWEKFGKSPKPQKSKGFREFPISPSAHGEPYGNLLLSPISNYSPIMSKRPPARGEIRRAQILSSLGFLGFRGVRGLARGEISCIQKLSAFPFV